MAFPRSQELEAGGPACTPQALLSLSASSRSLSGPQEGVLGLALSFPGQRVYESARTPAPSALGSPRPAQGLSPRDGPGDCCTDEGARSLPFSDDSSIFRGVNVLYCPLVYLQ